MHYLFEATNIEKAFIVTEIVSGIRSANPPGRFLKKDLYQSCWIEIGNQGARKKVGQCFHETKEPTGMTLKRCYSHDSDESD